MLFTKGYRWAEGIIIAQQKDLEMSQVYCPRSRDVFLDIIRFTTISFKIFQNSTMLIFFSY